MPTRLPFVLAPDLEIPVALDLIDELVSHVRRSLSLPTGEAVPVTRASDRSNDEDRVFTLPSDGGRPIPPRRDRRNQERQTRRLAQPPRLRYSVKAVRDGQTLNIKNATPATLKLVDYLRQHPGQLQTEIAEGTHMSKNTIANQLSLLSKHGALIKQDARPNDR